MVKDANRRKIPQDEAAKPVKHLDQVTRFKRRWRTAPKAKPPRTEIERAAREFADWLATKPNLTAEQAAAVHHICLAFNGLIASGHPTFARGLKKAMDQLAITRGGGLQ